MPNTNRPGRGRGVDLRALAGEHPQTHPAGRQSLHGVDQMGEVAAEAVEFPEHVALPQRQQAAVGVPTSRRGRREARSWYKLTAASTPAARRASCCRFSDWESSVLRDAGAARSPSVANEGLRHRRGPVSTFILVQITMRSTSSTVTVSGDLPTRFAGHAQVARCRRPERPRPVREPDPRGREDVRLDAVAGSGPRRFRTCLEASVRGPATSLAAADGATSTPAARPGRASRTDQLVDGDRRPPSRTPSATASAAPGVPGAKTPDPPSSGRSEVSARSPPEPSSGLDGVIDC